MNPGVCIRPYAPHGYLAPIPGPAAYRDLHDLGIRTIRTGVPVLQTTPPVLIEQNGNIHDGEVVFDFSLFMQWLMPIAGAAGGHGGPQTPWISIYANPGGCPPSFSEGQPAYIDETGIGVWPPGAPDVPESYCGGSWWNDPKNPGLGIHPFDQDPNRTDSVTLPDGKVLTGPELAAIDQKMPPRPYLTNPPHRDPRYAFNLGRQLMLEHGWTIHAIGPENEPGGGLLRRAEKTLGGANSDMMRDRMFPEVYIPFAQGVRSVAPNLNKPDLIKIPTLVGCEADSADILARYLDAEEAIYRGRPSLTICDKITIHPYGDLLDVGKPSSYRTMEVFVKVLADRKFFGFGGDRRMVSIGEIGGDPQALYDFTAEVVAKWPWITDIYYLEPAMFYEPGSSWTTLGAWDSKKSVLSAVGLKFQKLFAQMNARRAA